MVIKVYEDLETLHETHGVQWGKEGEQRIPLSYNGGIEQEIQSLITGVGILDLNANDLVELKGPDAATFLQGQITNNIERLDVGKIQSNLICTNKGKILYHVDILRRQEEEYVLLCERGEGRKVGGQLDFYHIQEDFEMRLLNPEELRCDLMGPEAEGVLKTLGGALEQPQWSWKNYSITAVSSPLGEIPRYVCLVPGDGVREWIETLLKENHVALVGAKAYEQVRVDQGIPQAGVDYTQEHFPQEASLMNHISYDKGCYLGQETHARMYHRGHPNRQLMALHIPLSITVDAGQSLYSEGEEVGIIQSLSHRQHQDHYRGIALIRYPVAESQVPLAIAPEAEPVIQQKQVATMAQES